MSEEIQLTDSQIAQIRSQEATFLETENALRACRVFWDKHKHTLLNFNFYAMYGWQPTVRIRADDRDKAVEIARAFGADGWKRYADSYTCGNINWVKEVDGVTVTIEGAETIKPTLQENVRL